MLYNGQPTEYALRLQAKYGEGIIKELNDLRRTTKQFNVPELERMIEEFTEKLKDIDTALE